LTDASTESKLTGVRGRRAREDQREELRQLDALTAARDFRAVLKLGAPLLMKPCSVEDLALVRFYLGQAHCRLVEPREALVCLPAARQQFELQKDERLAVEALDWEASAWGLLEDPRAFALENEALERCRKLDPRQQQLEARILGHLANMFVVTRSWSLAISHYEAAVAAASAVNDLLQLAKMHHGLGNAYQRSQHPSKARGHLDKALALYSIESDPSALYRVENDLGNLLLVEGRLDAAERHFLKALAGAEELHINRRGRGFILANLGEVCMRSGRTEEARRYLEDALGVGEAFGERIVVADAAMLLGRLEEGLGHPQSADDHYGSAIRALQEIEMPNRLRDCYVEYAQVLEARGDMRAAYRQLQLAVEADKTTAAESTG
jgi:tetratricopeptide (TPR) repeat protein